MTPDEFAGKVKAKYPQYQDIDNAELARRVVDKHPEYASQVDFGEVPEARDAVAQAPEGQSVLDVVRILGMGGGLGAAIAMEPGGLRAAAEGFLLKKAQQPETPFAGAIRTVAGALPPIAASMLAPGGGGALARMGQVGLAAGAGELARQEARVGAGLQDQSGALKEAGKTGALFAAGEGAFAAAGSLGGAIANRLKQTVGGLSKGALERISLRPKQVMSQLSRDAEAAPQLVDEFTSAVKENFNLVKEQYQTMVDTITEAPKYINSRFKLKDSSVAKDISSIQNDFGYGLPGRLGKSSSEGKKFLEVKKAVSELGDASARDIWLLQKDVNRLAGDNVGNQLGVALKRVQRSLRDFLGENIPEIREANKAYAKAASLDDAAAPILNAQNPRSRIKAALVNKTALRDKKILEEVSEEIPRAKKALDAVVDNLAGVEFDPLVARVPPTGLATGFGMLGFGAASGNPLALGSAAAMAPFASPRLIGNAELFAQYVKQAGLATPARRAAIGLGANVANR